MVEVVNGLEEMNNHVIYLNGSGELAGHLPPSCRIKKLNYRSRPDLLQCVWKLRKYIRQHNIGIVHSHLFMATLIARLACPRKVKLFNTIHAISSEASYKINRFTLYLEKLTYRRRHHIIAVSNEVLKDFDKWVGLKGSSTVLYNTINDKYFAPGPKSEFTKQGLRMVAVGNLRWQKNYPYLLEAFKNLPSGISLDIYGEGDLRDELQAEIDRYKLNIKLCGQHNRLYEILHEYDVFLMCSLYEGFSMGLMEAMASGLPPMLSNIPVLQEAAGDNAIYADLARPSDLTEKIQYFNNHKEKLKKIAQGAHARANALAKKEFYLSSLMGLYTSGQNLRTT
jgi:glycosyltransferase involved in cell wall biosynthesis